MSNIIKFQGRDRNHKGSAKMINTGTTTVCCECGRGTAPHELAHEGADLCMTCYQMIESGLVSEAAEMDRQTEAEIMTAAKRHGWVDVTSVAVDQIMGGVADMQRHRDALKTAADALISLEQQGRLDQRGAWVSPSRPERGGPMFVIPNRAPEHPSRHGAPAA